MMFRAKHRQSIRLLCLDNYPVYQQLQLEEALLRADPHQWCLINIGTPPAIVMGISGKPEELIDIPLLQQEPVPLIRRFSGGGTVFVDQHTCFVTWICNSLSTGIPCCPKEIMLWTEEIYKKIFFNIPFALKENDYVIGDKKCGGNAQYMRKERWLHHTSFLWDYEPSNMQYLLKPSRMPEYRQNRNHEDFLCRLSDHLPHKNAWLLSFISLIKGMCDVEEVHFSEGYSLINRPHRKMTDLINLNLKNIY